MDIQATILNGVMSILGVFVSIFFAAIVAYIKQHFSAKQISTASGIATEAVNYVAQITNKLQIPDSAKYEYALTKAKDLASKIGLNFTDAQWKTLLESAHKKAKDGLQPLQEIASTTTPYTEDDIANMIKAELAKVFVDPVPVSNESVEPSSDHVISADVSTEPKPITEVIQQTIDQVGEQAKTQAVNDLTNKFAAVVQEAVQPVGDQIDNVPHIQI